MRSLGFSSLVLVLVLSGACGSGGGMDGGNTTDGGARDLGPVRAGLCDAALVPVPDAAPVPTGRKPQPGDLGTPCTADTDCKHGPKPSCWKSTLLNVAGNLDTPGGYCSSSCTVDGDCADSNMDPMHPNLCVDFGTQAQPNRVCIAGCGDAVTCRHPGYACSYFGADMDNNLLYGCYPNANFDCNPKQPSCMTTNTSSPMAGGCWRQAYEDDAGGMCLSLCSPGGTCQKDVFGDSYGCLQVDFTGNGDAFRGTLCYPSNDTPVAAGKSCQYIDDCVTGYECDYGGASKCQMLCTLGKDMPKCPAGTTCQDAFGICTGAGLCR